MKRDNKMMIMFLTPALFSFLLVFLYPALRTLLMSFFYVGAIADRSNLWEFVGISNYIGLFQSQMFIQSLKNIFYIWFYGGIGVFIVALFLSLLLTSGYKGKDFFRAVLYLPNVVSAVAMGTMWIHYVFNSSYGLFHKFFGFLGFEALASFQWTSPTNQLLSMTIAYCFGMVGYYVLIFMAGIEKIPTSYLEAATLEGANIFQKFIKVTFPLMRGVFKSSIVMWSVTSIAFFIWSKTFSPLDPDFGTITPMVYMYEQVFGRSLGAVDPALLNAGAGAAVGVIMTVLTVSVFGLVNLLLRDKNIQY
jgi:multiple sugar transport system permease protein